MKMPVQQALFHHFVQPVSRIANLAAINPHTGWNHIHAAPKSRVKAWASRPTAEQDAAIAEADLIVKGNPSMCISRNSARRARIATGQLHAMIDTEISNRVQADDTFTAYSITSCCRRSTPAPT